MKISDLPYVTLYLRHCVPTMSLSCVVQIEDIKLQCEFFFFAFACPCRYIVISLTVHLKCSVTVKNACLGLFIDNVRDFVSGNPLNTDTPIIRTFWHVPLVSVLTG